MMKMTEEGKGNDTFCQQYEEALKIFFSSYVNKSEMTYPRVPDVWKKLGYLDGLKISICIIIITGGLLGNVSVILAVVLKKSTRTTINIYIASLAAADAMICLFCVGPLALLPLTNNMYILGEFMCKTESYVKCVCLTSSVMTLAAISCDRFVAIMLPLRARFTKQRPFLVMIVVWIASSIGAIPHTILNKHRTIQWKNFVETDCSKDFQYEWHYDESIGECIARISEFYTLYGIFLALIIFMPLPIMTVAYSFIVWKVWTTEAPGEQHEANIKADSRSRKKVNRMIFVVLLIFIICWLPSQATILYAVVNLKFTPKYVFRSSKAFPDFVWFSLCIAYTNSFMNPLIYAVLNKDLRHGMGSILRCVSVRNRWQKPDAILSPPRNLPKILEVMKKLEPLKSNIEMQSKFPGAEGGVRQL